MLKRNQADNRLVDMPDFGTNPGRLKALVHLPSSLPENPPLVVVLHGCTQSAAAYDSGSGWSELADRHGFALLYPEQQRANNGNLCFNWFQSSDITRGSGEAESIREMIGHLTETQGIDPARVFVTGLSAGGAMADVMLATYPEVFAAGAIIAGLPYGTATSVGEAFERMQGRNEPSAEDLQSLLARASRNKKDWPRVSVWQGTHDHTVKPRNAGLILEQWKAVHGISDAEPDLEKIGDHSHKIWRDRNGHVALESYVIQGMGHGVPLATEAHQPVGETGPYMLSADISSTARIAHFFGLLDLADIRLAEHTDKPKQASTPRMANPVARLSAKIKPRKAVKVEEQPSEIGVTKVIHDALRAAGLMK